MRFTSAGSVTVKAIMIGVIVLLLMIPLSLLRGLISERAGLREHAYARVAEGWGGASVLGGPVLIIPTERTQTEGEKVHIVRGELSLLPSRLNIDMDVQLESEPRRVGIYEVPVYLATVRLSGEFDFAALGALLGQPDTQYFWERGRLLLPMSQVRSLREVRDAKLASQSIEFAPAGVSLLAGIESPIDLRSYRDNGGRASFNFETTIAGSREISVLPFGSETRVQVHSNWPHPSFQGAFLPADRTITAEGFNAGWQVLELNRGYPEAWAAGEIAEPVLTSSAFGVALYQPSDVYQRGERAIKYALLFIALTFLTFFAWEQLSETRLHPLQYLLVGLALSTFYLLLIALSEHISFIAAYTVAAGALTLLIGVYIAGAVANRAHGFVAATVMAIVYGLLYVLVISEDYALLLGAITLFAALAAVMLVTRGVNWYQVGAARE